MVHFLFLVVSLFILGSCIGSFCGVIIETGVRRSFWTGRSQCASCYERLHWYELIPVISYLVQRGTCRRCHEEIPSWVLSIEVMMGLLWMLFGTILVTEWYSLWEIGTHLIILTMLLMLALEDIKSFTIPDRLSLPMIIITIILIAGSWSMYRMGLLQDPDMAILGWLVGMLFYIFQMIIPALLAVIQKKQFHRIPPLMTFPFFFPFWLIVKIFASEEQADKLIPSLSEIDDLPTWVGWGDVRLGILLGLILGPLYIWWTIGIGYTLGTVFWLIGKVFQGKKLDILPVAPLLFLGFCVTWLIRIYW